MKTKRKPSGRNLFIKKCMGKIDLKGKPFGSAGQYMKGCSEDWKGISEEDKEKYKNLSNKCELNAETNKWDCPELDEDDEDE